MKSTFYFLVMTTLLLLSQTVFAQTAHDVTIANFSFTPDTLTITVGDTVRWSCVQGTHNVVADDNSFTSGPVAPAPWTYSHVFTTESSNPYYCVLHGAPGGVGMSGVITVQAASDIRNEGISIYKFDLKQNYPNPFNPTTTIHYVVPKGSLVELRVYDVIGNEVETLVNEFKPAGNYNITFNAFSLSSGIYFYKLQAGSFAETRKMTLLK